MKKTVVEKLKSESGASLALALLFFLICAVIGSVVLSAATASSGRLSNIADNDQRYYSVTSAAVLVKDLIEDNEFSVLDDYSEAVLNDESAGSTPQTYVLEVSGEDLPDDLQVAVTITPYAFDPKKLTVSCTNNSAGDKYTLYMTCMANILNDVYIDDDSGVEKDHYSVQWSVSEIYK